MDRSLSFFWVSVVPAVSDCGLWVMVFLWVTLILWVMAF